MIETHWICDVCKKRIIESSVLENFNETGIRNWYAVNLHVQKVKDPMSGKSVHKYGYACSDDCLNKVIDWLKELAKDKIKQQKQED